MTRDRGSPRVSRSRSRTIRVRSCRYAVRSGRGCRCDPGRDRRARAAFGQWQGGLMPALHALQPSSATSITTRSRCGRGGHITVTRSTASSALQGFPHHQNRPVRSCRCVAPRLPGPGGKVCSPRRPVGTRSRRRGRGGFCSGTARGAHRGSLTVASMAMSTRSSSDHHQERAEPVSAPAAHGAHRWWPKPQRTVVFVPEMRLHSAVGAAWYARRWRATGCQRIRNGSLRLLWLETDDRSGQR